MNSIKNLRKKKRITQTTIADILQVEASTVSKWETGASLPRAELLPKLAKLLDCTVDDLLNNKPIKSEST